MNQDSQSPTGRTQIIPIQSLTSINDDVRRA